MIRKNIKRCLVACLAASLLFSAALPVLPAQTTFVTIGSGDFTGVYFPAGLAIAQMINAKRTEYGIRAAVESTRASVFNVNAIMAGYLEFGLVQSDKQYQAFNGLGEWAQKGPQTRLRAVFSLHHESVSLVAAVDAGISTIHDLKNKRVNLGNPGSGQYQNAIDALRAVDLNPQKDIYPQKVNASEAPNLLQDNRIDAFFCTLGHPSEILQQATSGARKVRFIPIAGPGIDKMIAGKGYYTMTNIPVAHFYPGAEKAADVQTFGVLATLCTASRVPEHVVYAITKEVFDHLEDFKGQHPALAALTREGMLQGLSAPLHPGAAQYYKQAGLMK